MYRRIFTTFIIVITATLLYAKPLDTRLTKLQFFGPDNSLFMEIVLLYDDRGNIIKSKQFDQFMRLLATEEYFFDENGNRQKEIVYDSSREVEKYTLIEVINGKRIRKTFNSDDILIMIMEDEYDKNGAVKKVTEYSVSNGKKDEVQSVSEYVRSGKNDLKCLRNAPGGELSYYYIIRFDNSGQIVEVIYYNAEGVKSGYVKILQEAGTMTEQSLDLVIY